MKINEMVKDGKHNYDKRNRDVVDKGRLRVNDLIAPDAIKIEPNHIQVGDRLIRTIFITGYPRVATIGWLNRLYSYGENIDISIHIEPLPTERVIKDLTKKITQFQTSQFMDYKKGKIEDIAISSAKSDAEELRAALHTGVEKLYYQAIYISVSGKTEEELDRITEEIETLCSSIGLVTRQAILQQEPGFATCLPLGQDRIRFKRNFSTSSLATCMPFVSSELTMTDGTPVLYGINMLNGSLVMFDRFSLNNYNSVTLATSGAGKSFFVKLESIRYMGLGANVIIVDPNGEYRRLVDTYGGQYIRLASGSKHKINPLDVELVEEEEGKNFLVEKILGVVSIIEVMINRKLSAREKKILLDSTEETYKKFGITRNKESLQEDTFDEGSEFFQLDAGTKKMPTLSDLEGTLRQKGGDAVNLADELEPYTSGVLSLFNGETNVDLDSNFIVFDIKDMEKELADLAMFITLEFIWNKIKRNDKKRRLLVVDEAWQLMRNEQSANYLIGVAKIARKFNAGLSIISQNVEDFLKNNGEGIITNAEMKVLLRQSNADIEKLTQLFGMSASEQGFVRSAGKGEALLFLGGNRTAVQVIADELEFLLCDTSPENRDIIEQMLGRY
ncbi:ATP-binding protein [Priestia filamentosa]|uniref:VirB4-like conjugal transfer ATPase, CD1110 family n=1 Tax=Priestia filamentosa TaxID=1402861 RepID=UPI00397817D5